MAQLSQIIYIDCFVFDVVGRNTEGEPRKCFAEKRCLKDIYFGKVEQILDW